MKIFKIAISILIFVLLMVGLMVESTKVGSGKRKHRYATIEQDGKLASSLDVPAEANPYTYHEDRKAWLNGWMSK